MAESKEKETNTQQASDSELETGRSAIPVTSSTTQENNADSEASNSTGQVKPAYIKGLSDNYIDKLDAAYILDKMGIKVNLQKLCSDARDGIKLQNKDV